MTTEDQIVALFADANPVPSLDLLDPVEPVDPGRLTDRSERSWEMTDLETIEATDTEPRRRWLIPALATIGVLVVAIPLLMYVLPIAENSTPAEQVAYAFIEGINEYDDEAVREMFVADERYIDIDPELWPVIAAHDRALGVEYEGVDCIELTSVSFPDGTPATAVECSFMLRQDLMTALGLQPTPGTYAVYINNGKIVRATETWPDSNTFGESLEQFEAWVERTHPEDYETMFDSPLVPNMEPGWIALWEQYTAEFVAEQGG